MTPAPHAPGEAPVVEERAPASVSGPPADDRLPPLLTGSRRTTLLRLLGTGAAQAALAVQTVLVVPMVLDAPTTLVRVLGVLALVAGAAVLGLVRARERVLAERLGQDYVQEIRTGLVASALTGSGPSLGVTVARTTNDLTSVRTWVALGVAPLAVAGPVVLGVLTALVVVHPLLGLAVAVPLVGFALSVVVVAPRVLARASELRRHRGVLAAHVADTVAAAPGIVAAGGTTRELRHVERRGARVRDAAIARAEASGVLRGSAAATGALATVAVLAVAGPAGLGASGVATALTVVGILVAPVADLGRVVEYRQSFLAARRILGPALAPGRAARAAELARRTTGRADGPTAPEPTEAPAGLAVRGLVLDGRAVPDLVATPGERVVLSGSDPALRRAVLEVLAGVRAPEQGTVVVGGEDLAGLDARRRRERVGAALAGWSLERGTVARAVGYRLPDSGVPVADALAATGLDRTLATLPDGDRTRLRRGGAPLDRADRARVLLARAVHGRPALVVLDHLDDELDGAGRASLAGCVRAQPGVVVLASEAAWTLVPRHRVWDLDAG